MMRQKIQAAMALNYDFAFEVGESTQAGRYELS
jgi:hypothetical protein